MVARTMGSEAGENGHAEGGGTKYRQSGGLAASQALLRNRAAL